MDEKVDGIETSILIHRAEELQRERDEKQKNLEALARRLEALQYEMDEKAESVKALTHRVEELQRERDELRKDIEQLCMQQAGPGYISVATRMLSQRTAGLEEEIQNLKKKLGGCLRENQNLQEELAEAYRVKSQLADLHGVELLKNKDLEKQVRFFQSSVAQAFAERDHSFMECEKAKESEEAISKQLIDFEKRTKEYQSALVDQKRLNDALQMELGALKTQTDSSMKVISKFYEIRERDIGCPPNITMEEKCSTLLDDCADNWIFRSDGETSTSKYIASLEDEKDSLKSTIAKLQSNLRMGLEIEQHLQRNARTLDRKQKLYDNLMRNGVSDLQKFYINQRAEIMKILEEESSHLSTLISEVQDKLGHIQIDCEIGEAPSGKQLSLNTQCKDVHVNMDINPDAVMKGDLPACINIATFDDSKALAQALQEKMDALMLFSQEEERYLLERQKNQILIEDLQKNLSQVKDEKVKALMELAKLKEEYLLLKDYVAKHGDSTVDSLKIISGHEQGMLKTFLKRTSLKHWIKKEGGHHGHESSDGKNPSVSKESSVDLARLKVENATLFESYATLERLTSSVHRLHSVLMKAHDDVKSAVPVERTYEALNSLITEANLMKMALGAVLPVSWPGDSSDTITYEALHDPVDLPVSSKSKKVVGLSTAGLEMVELLILAAEILKESFMGRNMDAET